MSFASEIRVRQEEVFRRGRLLSRCGQTSRHNKGVRRAKKIACQMWQAFRAYVRSDSFDFRKDGWPMREEHAQGWGQKWRLRREDFSPKTCFHWPCTQALHEVWQGRCFAPRLIGIALMKISHRRDWSYDALYGLSQTLAATADAFGGEEIVWLPLVSVPRRAQAELVGYLLARAEPRATDFASHSPFRYFVERALAEGMRVTLESAWLLVGRGTNRPQLSANVTLVLPKEVQVGRGVKKRYEISLSAGQLARLECRSPFEI